MPASSDPSSISLRQRVENLATKLIIGDADGPEWLANLTVIREQAENSGPREVAGAAAASIEALRGAPDFQSVERIFSENIRRMQLALEQVDSAGDKSDESTSFPAQAEFRLADDAGLMGEFVIEAREHLVTVEAQLLTLEKDPRNSEAINAIFRGFHTIKGLAGFLELAEVRDVAHETETLLDHARNSRLAITPAIVDTVLAASDFLKTCFDRLETRLAGGELGPIPPSANLLDRIRQASAAARSPLPAAVDEQSIKADPLSPEDDDSARHSRVASSVKIETSKLDYLVDMSGEMVIAQSMIRHHPELAALRNPVLQRSISQLARITSELQKTAMSMRMVSVAGLFQKMARLNARFIAQKR